MNAYIHCLQMLFTTWERRHNEELLLWSIGRNKFTVNSQTYLRLCMDKVEQRIVRKMYLKFE